MSSSLDNTNSDHILIQNPSDTAQTDHTDTFDNTQNETPLNLLHAGKSRDSRLTFLIFTLCRQTSCLEQYRKSYKY